MLPVQSSVISSGQMRYAPVPSSHPATILVKGCIMQEEGVSSPDDETALLVPCLAHIKVVSLPLVPSDVHLVPIAYSEKLNRMSVEGHVVLEDPQ